MSLSIAFHELLFDTSNNKKGGSDDETSDAEINVVNSTIFS